MHSRADPASTNIAENLIKHLHFSKSETSDPGTRVHSKSNLLLVEIDEPGIYAKRTDIPREATTLIFASKHVSSRGKPALTVHATGNPTREALYGGIPEHLSYVDPPRIKNALHTLRDESVERGLEMENTMEATHHGPTSFEIPVTFVEIVRPCAWRSRSDNHYSRRREHRVQRHEGRGIRRYSLLVQAQKDRHGRKSGGRPRHIQARIRRRHFRHNYQTSIRQDPNGLQHGTRRLEGTERKNNDNTFCRSSNSGISRSSDANDSSSTRIVKIGRAGSFELQSIIEGL